MVMDSVSTDKTLMIHIWGMIDSTIVLRFINRDENVGDVGALASFPKQSNRG